MPWYTQKSLRQQDFWELTDYRIYRFSAGELVWILFQCAVIVGGAAYFTYHSVMGLPILLPLGIFWFLEQKKAYTERRCQQLRWQFKEMLLSVAASLQAGSSVENAFKEAGKDMAVLFGDSADIVKELSVLSQALANSIPVEQVLSHLAERSSVGEIRDFAQVFVIGKRSGADMGEMIENTVRLISEKVEVAREIKTVMSAKVMEQRVMSLVPFGIMGYIGMTSPGFFGMLYHNLFGMIFMSVCLLIYLGAFWLGRKIVRIEV